MYYFLLVSGRITTNSTTLSDGECKYLMSGDLYGVYRATKPLVQDVNDLNDVVYVKLKLYGEHMLYSVTTTHSTSRGFVP